MKSNSAKLFLVPATLGDVDPIASIPAAVFERINEIDDYLVENEKSARQYLKKLGIKKPLQKINLHLLDKRTAFADLSPMMQALVEGKNMGVLSEAGCPGIADPGALAVKWAHQNGFDVVPLTGPSSILLALMASGFNGQSFAFQGYLPIDRSDRIKKIKELEKLTQTQHQTQIFIETPYRNNHLIEDVLQHCQPHTKLCIAVDLTLSNEFVKSKTIAAWRQSKPDLHKRPAIFLLDN